ncbi:hypothetical protein J1605_013133 [Eschrichtius robustus]|uniref:Krueppel-like factor 7 n=1 Tax=Eschrichtius robustus TaxID=9764 RepID=A0AB34GHG9_ESCRO|nr:hypothetical protein J1605_013133 [Eschrichtius robustus]
MDVLASYSIFQELQLVHDTGYFSALPSLEETWQQRTSQETPKMLKGTDAKLARCPSEGEAGLVTSSLGFVKWNKESAG